MAELANNQGSQALDVRVFTEPCEKWDEALCNETLAQLIFELEIAEGSEQ